MDEGDSRGGGLSLRELCEGNLEGGASLLVTPKDMLSKVLEIEVCFHTGPGLGNMEERSFPRTLERRDTFLYLGEFL